VPTFVAYVEFRFDAETIEMGGERLRELSTAAADVGFEVERARVEQAPEATDAYGSQPSW
jgi:hypothetical protein